MAEGQARVRRKVAAAVAAACALVLLAGCTAPSQAISGYEQAESEFSPEIAERLDATLDEAVRLSGSSGAVAGVWAPWAGAWTTGVGTVGFEDGAEEVTAETRFQLATATGEAREKVLYKIKRLSPFWTEDALKQAETGTGPAAAPKAERKKAQPKKKA